MNQLLLWDIDGTIILGGNVGAKALAHYFEKTYGFKQARMAINTLGMTDPRIVDEVFAHFDYQPTVQEHQAVLDEYVNALAMVMAKPNNGSRCLPGIPEVFEPIHQDINWYQGLLTGNVAEAARLKLEYHGLWSRFDFGAFGEDGVQRSDLIPVAWERAKSHTGINFGPYNTWIIGDTPKDAAAAAVHQTRLALVATSSKYSVEELQACKPDLVFEDLSDTAMFWNQLRDKCLISS